ncbi:MAG: HD domain-containing phosphohydrolase [Motiliproteus sp.]
MLEHSAELRHLQQRIQFDDLFRHIGLSGNLPLQIRQKLTVMSQQLPDLFEHSLFTGWAAALIANEMKYKPDECWEAYVCGLIHDIGLLHLSPEIQTQTPLSEENWRALQSHVIIGQRSADASGLPTAIGRGILDHHERLDQTGYPTRKAPAKLGQLGQIVASADLLHSLCSNELSHTEGSIHEALPYFKIHRSSFSESIHSALMRILFLAAPDPIGQNRPIQPANLERVRKVNSLLLDLFAPLAELSQKTAASEHAESQSVATLMQSINTLLDNSGIGDRQLSDWLMSELAPSDPDNHSCLKEIDAMQYELLWLVKRLGWSLKSLLESSASNLEPATRELSPYYELLMAQLSPAFALYSPQTEQLSNQNS